MHDNFHSSQHAALATLLQSTTIWERGGRTSTATSAERREGRATMYWFWRPRIPVMMQSCFPALVLYVFEFVVLPLLADFIRCFVVEKAGGLRPGLVGEVLYVNNGLVGNCYRSWFKSGFYLCMVVVYVMRFNGKAYPEGACCTKLSLWTFWESSEACWTVFVIRHSF